MKFILICSLTLFLGGCIYASEAPTTVGIVWQSTLSPIKPEEQMKASGAVPARIGASCKYQAFGLVTWGNDSYGQALRKGKIRRVASIDRLTEGSQLLGTGRVCTVVTGQ